MTLLMNRPPYSLLSKALTFIPRRRMADASGAPQSSLMAEYLVISCGFDPDEAAKASKLLGGIESRRQPDSVLGFFKSYGFDDALMKGLLSSNPRWLLLLDVEKTLAPKFRALQDLGFSCSDITHLVRSNNTVIGHNLQNVLSKIQVWEDLLGSKDLLVKLCKNNRWLLGYSIEKRIQPNIEILRDCGITDQKLSVILRHHPFLVTRKARGFGSSSHLRDVPPDLDDPPLRHREELQGSHLEFFKGFGWSEDDSLAAFRKTPTLVGLSLKSLQRKMEFLVNETSCAPSYLATRPVILLLSLEKRLIPRYRILTGLKSRGVLIRNLQMVTYMKYPEKKFLEKFVICYRECPERIELYN